MTCNSSMEQADQAYMDAVKALEDARVTWEKEMENMCQVSLHSRLRLVCVRLVCKHASGWVASMSQVGLQAGLRLGCKHVSGWVASMSQVGLQVCGTDVRKYPICSSQKTPTV